jgi:hypothetical protein
MPRTYILFDVSVSNQTKNKAISTAFPENPKLVAKNPHALDRGLDPEHAVAGILYDPANIAAIQRAFEAAGIEFIGEVGVRVK